MATVTTLERFGILEVGEKFFNGIGFTCIGQKFAQISQKWNYNHSLPLQSSIAKTISALIRRISLVLLLLLWQLLTDMRKGKDFIENLNLKCGYGANITNASMTHQQVLQQ